MDECKKCVFFYRVMATAEGYNPFPRCHCYEETGKSPDPLEKSCFKKKKTTKELQEEWKKKWNKQ